uniref:Uncharacterized protein n=1 Tax=Triticum urartu TaxID=4572 RepID=A0A8R7P7I3_TRIUA
MQGTSADRARWGRTCLAGSHWSMRAFVLVRVVVAMAGAGRGRRIQRRGGWGGAAPSLMTASDSDVQTAGAAAGSGAVQVRSWARRGTAPAAVRERTSVAAPAMGERRRASVRDRE